MKSEILAANDNLPMDNGNPEAGTMVMANAARFIEAHFSEPLTTYATGWRDQEGLQDLLDFIAPPVEVPRRFEYISYVNPEAFLSETDDVRAIGSDFKRVEYTQSKLTSTTLNKGLTYRVDLDNVDPNTNWREKIVSQLQLRIIRNDVRRAMALLIAAATNTAVNWTTHAGSGALGSDNDPDMELTQAVINFNTAVGIPPTSLLFDLTAWGKRFLAARASNAAGNFASAGLTIDQVAQLVGCQKGMISRYQYQSTPSAKASVLGGAYALVFLANPAQSIDDPSNMKRFVTQTMGGTMVRVYEQQVSMKLIDISVEMYSRPVLTSSLGMQLLTVS